MGIVQTWYIPVHTGTYLHVRDSSGFWILLHPAGPPESGAFVAAYTHTISSTTKFTFKPV
jgi:hypothetical protein